MFNVVLWLRDKTTDQTTVEAYRCKSIAVSDKMVVLYVGDGAEAFDREVVSMIDFNSRGIKRESIKNSL